MIENRQRYPRPASRGRIRPSEDSSTAGSSSTSYTTGVARHNPQSSKDSEVATDMMQPQQNQQQQGGHVFQSRIVTQSHVIPRARSRSKGRKKRPSQSRRKSAEEPAPPTASDGGVHHRSKSEHGNDRFDDIYNQSGNSSMKLSSASLGASLEGMQSDYSEKIDHQGRCVRHSNIELCRREANGNMSPSWRVLLQDCPLCSLDTSQKEVDLAQRTPAIDSTQTATTSPSSDDEGEESSQPPSWTLSDASSSEDEQVKTKSRKRQPVVKREMMKPPAPPPPKQSASVAAAGSEPQKRSNSKGKGRAAPQSSVKSLKELGRKLAMENEAGLSAVPGDDVSMGASTAVSKQRPPPPRFWRSGSNETSLSKMSTKELSALRRQRRAEVAAGILQQNQGGEDMSEVTSHISKMNTDAASLKSGTRSHTKRRSERSRKMATDGDETASFATTPETESILGAAAAVRSRARRNVDRSLERRKAEQRGGRNQRSASDGTGVGSSFTGGEARSQITITRLNDEQPSRTTLRGRSHSNDDILGAAAEIRSRARRSLSRSRERNKAAAMFCGETPPDHGDDDDEGFDDQMTVATTETKRSILNPHGLANQPEVPRVERRSQSRGKTREGEESVGDQEAESTGMDRRPRSRGRRRDARNMDANKPVSENMQSSAEMLINRRREMRQKIAERHSKGKKGHGYSDSADAVDHLSLKEEMMEEWTNVSNSTGGRRTPTRSRLSDQKDGARRGRSRSVVRDGLSRIRSASVNAFKKRASSVQGDRDENTIDTSKKSTRSSLTQRMHKVKNFRSLSRGRFSSRDDSDARSDTKSESFAMHNTPAWATDEDDEKQSRSSILKRLSQKKPISKGQSLSRGSFRGDIGGIVDHSDAKSEGGWRTNESDRFSRSSFLHRLSKSKPEEGMVRSLSRGSFRETGGAKSDSFALTGNPWATDDVDAFSNSSKHQSTKKNVRSLSRGNYPSDDEGSFAKIMSAWDD